MEEGDDPFSKAWEASPQSSFSGAWSTSSPSGDPWGNMDKEEPWTSKDGGGGDHVGGKSEHSMGTQQLNRVFQPECNISSSAIDNKNNNSNTDLNEFSQGGFDDNFGEWSETDVLFKSGLLDQEFKTVCVTAEEDDLWSSADISSLNLSLKSPSFTTQDASQRPEEVSKILSTQEVDVLSIHGGSGGDFNDSAKVNLSSVPNSSSQNQLSGKSVGQDENSGQCGQLESGQVQLGGSGDSVSSGPSFENNSAHSVTHTELKSTAGSYGSSSVAFSVTPFISVQPKVNGTTPSSQGETVPSENTSIISTQNNDASNREAALSVDAEHSDSYSVGAVDKLSDTALTHTGDTRIPLQTGNKALRSFKDSKEQRIMGNILDSDKEEEKMEAVEAETHDKREQTVPSDPEEKSAAPTVDMKESVAVTENGSNAMVNGDQGDNETPLNDSLDIQTQTREDEFPPDDDYAEDTPQEPEPEKLVVEENGVLESQGNIGTEDAAARNLPDVIETEDSSEGYGSQDADKTLDSENGTEIIAPVEKEEEEKVVSQDEGLASPESEDSNAVSTLESIQTIEGDMVESGNVDKGVDVVIVDHSLEFEPNIVGNGDTPVPQGVPEVIGVGDNRDTEQTQGTLELRPENKQMDRNEVEGKCETNTSSQNHTDQTDIVHDVYTGTQNISDREEGQVTKDGMSEQADSGDVSKCEEYSQSHENNSVPSKQVDINATDKGMNQDTETTPQQEGVLLNNDQTEPPLVEFKQGGENSMEGGPEMNSDSQKEEALDLSLVNVDSEKECSPEVVPVHVPAEIVTATFGVPQLTDQPLKEPTDKGEGFEIMEGSGYPDNQDKLFQECNTTSEATKSLDLDKELDINNLESREEATVDSEYKKTTEMVKPVEENIVEFVDEVLSKAMEQLSSEQTKESPEAFQENEKVADMILDGGAEDEPFVMDEESNGLVSVEADNSVLEEGLSQKIDMDTNGNVKLDLNLVRENVSEGDTLVYMSSDIVSAEGGVVKTGETTPEKDLSEEHAGSKGTATRSQRWSVPAGSFTNSQFSYGSPSQETSIADATRELSPLSKRQFRPVKFRPASSSSSSESKLRRTSLGVPRGWNAPPVDVFAPPAETEDTNTVGEIAKEAGPSSLTSETSTSSGSSMSAQSSLSSEGWRPKEQGDMFHAVPVMVSADVVEVENSAPVQVEPKSDKLEAGVTLDASLDGPLDEKSALAEVSPVFHSFPQASPEKKAEDDQPSIPAPVKRTPPLSQKVEVYEIKDVPATSPTAKTMRQTFSQNRSVTEGEEVTRKKMSQAERERQDLLASLRVRRPVKEKWQGQIELEEKEKEKQVHLEGTTFKSLKGYEERKKIKIKSRSFDLSSSGELSVATPIANSQEAEGELNSGSSHESPIEREIRLHKEKENAHKEEQLSRVSRHRPHSLNFDGDSSQGDLYLSKEEVLSPNGDTCSSGYTSGRSTPAGEDASRLLSLPKHGGSGDSPLYKEYQNLLKEAQEAEEREVQRLPSREETGLRPVVSEEPIRENVPDHQQEPVSPQQKSFVQKEVKMREKKINSRVVKQNRISFVEQEVLRQKQQEEEFRREREMREQERSHAKPLSPSPPSSTSGSTVNSRVTSPTPPEPTPKPAKAPTKQPPSKAKAVYQELQYNPKTGVGNRSTAMVKEWESKFKK